MALLSDTDPDPTPRSTLCCDSTVGTYKQGSNPGRRVQPTNRVQIRVAGFKSGSALSSGCKRNLFGFVSPLGSVFDIDFFQVLDSNLENGSQWVNGNAKKAADIRAPAAFRAFAVTS